MSLLGRLCSLLPRALGHPARPFYPSLSLKAPKDCLSDNFIPRGKAEATGPGGGVPGGRAGQWAEPGGVGVGSKLLSLLMAE